MQNWYDTSDHSNPTDAKGNLLDRRACILLFQMPGGHHCAAGHQTPSYDLLHWHVRVLYLVEVSHSFGQVKGVWASSNRCQLRWTCSHHTSNNWFACISCTTYSSSATVWLLSQSTFANVDDGYTTAVHIGADFVVTLQYTVSSSCCRFEKA